MLFRLGCAIALLLLLACRGGRVPPRDPHSHAQPDRVAVRDLALDLSVDFTARTLAGTARLSLARIDRGAPLILDAEGLAIQRVTDCAGGELAHRAASGALRIELGAAECVELAYRTAPDAGALLWVEPAGTAGKREPMLFTQSQATRARTWIPIQDTPSVRFTYRATIRPPHGMWALMSADNPQAPPADGAWTFRQPQPIPAYLMALAVGDFAFRATGPRSGVYAEPSLLEAAASEFAEVEQMIAAAERLYGPYRWGRFDMLVLPPSFPYGGMENPNLTFLTPTVITGDRTLVSLIAHELAHSWSGNLVTNRTWNDFWLNEGFTTYVEHRIMEELRGREHADVLWHMSGKSIERALARHGRSSPATRLSHAYGRDTPVDEIPSELAYDKGALFLRTLEQAYGRGTFDAFLRGWFDRHAFGSVDSRMFEREAKAQLGTRVDLAAWLYQPGLPSGAAPTASARASAIEARAAGFVRDAGELDVVGWSTLDWVVFLKALPRDIPRQHLSALDARHGLTASANAEIGMHWLPRLVAADAREAAPAIESYLLRIGRRRMVVPLYEAMVGGGAFWRDLAIATFERARATYHPATRETIAKLVAKS